MKLLTAAIAIGILAAFSSCAINEELQYKGYNNFKVSGGLEDPQLSVDLNLYNPNPIGAKLKVMEVEVKINNTDIGTVKIDKPVRMKSRETFVLPLLMETSKEQLNSLVKPGLESLLFDKPLALQISGNMTIKKFIFFKKTFAFNYADELKISDLKIN